MKKPGKVSAVLALCLMLGGEAMAFSKPINEPSVEIPAGRSADEVVASIKAAMRRSGNWAAEREGPGLIVAQYMVRTHHASVDIHYDDRAVQLKYGWSFNLSYETDRQGVRRISSHYNRWVGALADHIRESLTAGPPEDVLTLVKLARGPVRNEPLSAFSKFELRELEVKPSSPRFLSVNRVSAQELQASIEQRIKPLLEQWQLAAQGDGGGRTLILEPVFENAGYVGTGHLVGPGRQVGFAWVQVRLRCTDAASGDLVAERLFSGRSAMPNEFHMQLADSEMLTRLVADMEAALAQDYTVSQSRPTPE